MREAISERQIRLDGADRDSGNPIGMQTIGFEGRFDYAAIGTVSNVASRLCDEASC